MRCRCRSTQRRVGRDERLEHGLEVGEHVEEGAREDDVEAVERVLLVHVAADEPPRRPALLRSSDDRLRVVRPGVLEAARRPALEQLAVRTHPAADVEKGRSRRQPLLAHEHVEQETERPVRGHVVWVLQLRVRQLSICAATSELFQLSR